MVTVELLIILQLHDKPFPIKFLLKCEPCCVASVSPPAIQATLTTYKSSMISTKSEVFTLPIRQNSAKSVNGVNPKKNNSELYSHNLGSSDITDDWIRIFGSYSGTQTSQTALPAFGETFKIYSSNTEENSASHVKVEECSGHADTRSKRLATILPGVIRHTSHPDRSLAYYYSDRG